MTAMPPLWLTIDTTPGVRRSCSRSIDVNDAVSPLPVLRMPTQLGPHSRKPLSAAERGELACWRARPSPPTSANPPAHATPAGTPAVDALPHDVDDAVGGNRDDREIRDGRAARAGSESSAGPRPCRGPGLTGQTGPAKAEASQDTRWRCRRGCLRVGRADDRDRRAARGAASARRTSSRLDLRLVDQLATTCPIRLRAPRRTAAPSGIGLDALRDAAHRAPRDP